MSICLFIDLIAVLHNLKKQRSFYQYSPPSNKTQRTCTRLISDLLVHGKSFHRFRTYGCYSPTPNSGCSLLARCRVHAETHVDLPASLSFIFPDAYGNGIKSIDCLDIRLKLHSTDSQRLNRCID